MINILTVVMIVVATYRGDKVQVMIYTSAKAIYDFVIKSFDNKRIDKLENKVERMDRLEQEFERIDRLEQKIERIEIEIKSQITEILSLLKNKE